MAVSGPAAAGPPPGNVVGGTFGGNFKITNDEEKRVRGLAIPATNCERAASLNGVFSSSATSSHAALNRGRIKRAFSSAAEGCKEKLSDLGTGETPYLLITIPLGGFPLKMRNRQIPKIRSNSG